MSSLYDALGDDTRNKLKNHRAWVLAQLIGELLYNGSCTKVWGQRRKYDGEKWVDDGDYPEVGSGTIRFVTSNKNYVPSWAPDYVKKQIGAEPGKMLDTERLLREVQHALEAVAVKEVT
jgi:hypothetical protein